MLPTTESYEEDIEIFYNELDLAQSRCKSQDIIIIFGDFIAKVGSERFEDTAGPCGLGESNERGDRLFHWVKQHNLIIGNTCYQQHQRRKWTW